MCWPVCCKLEQRSAKGQLKLSSITDSVMAESQTMLSACAHTFSYEHPHIDTQPVSNCSALWLIFSASELCDNRFKCQSNQRRFDKRQ